MTYYCGEIENIEVIAMPDYKSMYFKLAARVADAIELLTIAQQEAEEAYIEAEEDEDRPLHALEPVLKTDRIRGIITQDDQNSNQNNGEKQHD